MGRGRVPPSEVIGAAEFHRYFDVKVADVRALTDSVTVSQTLGIFRRRLKTHLFAVSLAVLY